MGTQDISVARDRPLMADTSSGQALVVTAPHAYALELRTADQTAGPAEVIVQPTMVGLCGTDLEILDGTLDPAYVRYPLVLGHEWVGRVVAVGAEVENVLVGDAVVVEGIMSCGHCPPCRRGRTNMCENYDELGFTMDGALQPSVRALAQFVHRIDPTVKDEDAALVEPSAVVLRGLREVSPVPGMSVAIVGDGTVALLAAALAQLWSPSRTVMIGLRPEQEALAVEAGVSEYVVGTAEGRFDLVVEAAGSTKAVSTALSMVRPGGSLLLLGIAGEGETVPVRVDDLVNHDLTVRGSFSYDAEAWGRVVALVNSGAFRPGFVVTHRFDLAGYDAAFEALRSRSSEPRGKVLFDLTR